MTLSLSVGWGSHKSPWDRLGLGEQIWRTTRFQKKQRIPYMTSSIDLIWSYKYVKESVHILLAAAWRVAGYIPTKLYTNSFIHNSKISKTKTKLSWSPVGINTPFQWVTNQSKKENDTKRIALLTKDVGLCWGGKFEDVVLLLHLHKSARGESTTNPTGRGI